MAGTWKVWVVEPGMDAEYIGLNAMVSELGFEQVPPLPADPSGDAPDDEELEHAEIPPPTAHPATLIPTAQAIRYERSFMGLPFGEKMAKPTSTDAPVEFKCVSDA